MPVNHNRSYLLVSSECDGVIPIESHVNAEGSKRREELRDVFARFDVDRSQHRNRFLSEPECDSPALLAVPLPQ